MDNQFLTVQEVSRYLGIKPATLYSKVEARKIPCYKFGRLVRFRPEDIQVWVENHRQDTEVVNQRAKAILRATKKNGLDIDQLIKKSIDEVNHLQYTPDHGRPDRIRGLRKEVKDESLS
jgi:excisionase family DNA binding protein